jgi:arachidonate 15-lipoxygenase
LVSQDGGRVPGLGDNGSFGSLNHLIDAVTLIVYTASVQHAAVNFPQYDLMSYVPNMPLACFAPAPTKKTGATLQDVLAMLPPHRPTGLQLSLGYLLGTVHYSRLGDYGWHHFGDKQVNAPLSAFQKQLEVIGKTIDKRNAARRPYEFLVPSGIPQSINI